MGGTKFSCNSVARQIWLWCYKNNNWVAAHLPGKDNVTADKQSRSTHDNVEWKLNPMLFSKICDRWGKPDIDLFASRLNNQTQKYCSWKPDPGAVAVDALSIDWGSLYFYAFPPFNMVGRVLRKIEEDEAEGITVVPHWPTQPWFPKLLKLCGNDVFILYRRTCAPQSATHGERKQPYRQQRYWQDMPRGKDQRKRGHQHHNKGAAPGVMETRDSQTILSVSE